MLLVVYPIISFVDSLVLCQGYPITLKTNIIKTEDPIKQEIGGVTLIMRGIMMKGKKFLFMTLFIGCLCDYYCEVLYSWTSANYM